MRMYAVRLTDRWGEFLSAPWGCVLSRMCPGTTVCVCLSARVYVRVRGKCFRIPPKTGLPVGRLYPSLNIPQDALDLACSAGLLSALSPAWPVSFPLSPLPPPSLPFPTSGPIPRLPSTLLHAAPLHPRLAPLHAGVRGSRSLTPPGIAGFPSVITAIYRASPPLAPDDKSFPLCCSPPGSVNVRNPHDGLCFAG